MKKSMIMVIAAVVWLMAVIVFAGCGNDGNAGKGGSSDEAVSGVENQDMETEEGKDDSAGVRFKAEKTYKADIDAYEISFSSVAGLMALEPNEFSGIVDQSFYTENASHSIRVAFVPVKYAMASDIHTAEEYKDYPWDETVTPLTVYMAEDVTIDGWSGYYYEYHDENMDFDAMGYALFNEAGDRVDFSQMKRDGGYLPIEDICIR